MNELHEERERVIASARQGFAALPGPFLEETELGQPLLVRSVRGEPGYWLVAGLRAGRIVAVARILRDASIATMARLREPAIDAAAAVTGMSEARAGQLRNELMSHAPDASIGDPALVYDGSVGREAWLYVLRARDGTETWALATGGGVAMRPAGTAPPGSVSG